MIESTLVTDDWRWLDIGDATDTTEDLIKRGLSGTATFTPVGLSGASVDDSPDWSIAARPQTARYTLGRLVGDDGVQGVRLVSAVDGTAVVWQVSRTLRWNGEAIPGIDPVTVVFAGEVNHLPEMRPVVPDGSTPVTDALLAVREFIAAAETAATRAEAAESRAVPAAARAEEAATQAAGFAERVGSAADVIAARDDAVAAAGRADLSKNAAVDAALQAQTAAASVDPDAIRQEVTEQIAAVVDGAPEDLDTIREVATFAQENRDITDTLNAAIGAKADKTHTHTSADVTGLQDALDGKASTTHTHQAGDVTGLGAAVEDAVSVAVTGKIQTVATLPATPTAGTFYFVTGA